MADEFVVRIENPKVVAGVVVRDGKVVGGAPVFKRWMFGWTLEKLYDYCERRGWKAERIDDSNYDM